MKSGYARILVELCREYHLDPHQIIKESGLPADLFELDQEFLPHDPFKRLVYLLGNQLGITHFGELIRTAIRRKALPRLIGEFSGCATVQEALLLTQKVFALDSTNVNVGIEQSHGRSWYWCQRQYDHGQSFLWSEVWAVVYITELIRALTKSDWMPRQIKIQSDDTDVYKAVVCSSTQYFVGNHRIEWLIEDDILSHPIMVTSSDSMITKPLLDWHSSFTDQVFTALLPYVKERNLTLEFAAQLLKITTRTFQRRLKEEKTSFRYLKDNLILTTSIQLMEENHSITYIANQLGFSDIAHFSRAFKRISGLTPKMYQKTILSLHNH
ncbi:helix-turn-helix domain-containing protein [Vibrio paucivorans]